MYIYTYVSTHTHTHMYIIHAYTYENARTPHRKEKDDIVVTIYTATERHRRKERKMCVLTEVVYTQCGHFGARETVSVCANGTSFRLKSGCWLNSIQGVRRHEGLFCKDCQYLAAHNICGTRITFRPLSGDVIAFSNFCHRGRDASSPSPNPVGLRSRSNSGSHRCL